MTEEYIVRVLENDDCITEGELIRCRECKWSSAKKKERLYHCSYWYRSVYDDDYCSRAERKDNDTR